MTEDSEQARNHFLDSEIRCDFVVTRERKELWQCLLNILEPLIDICDRHQIMYSMTGGSLLGAIRHGGFIPWDDDMDIAVPRKDYERLVEVLPKELPKHLFAQTPISDPEWRSSFLRVVNLETTALDENYARAHYHMAMGVAIDVFPIDFWPKSKVRRSWNLFWNRLFSVWRREAYRHALIKWWEWPLVAFSKMSFRMVGNERVHRWREKLFTSCPEGGHYSVCPARWRYAKHSFRCVEWHRSYVRVPFEYLQVQIPIDYERVLESIYGNWRKLVKGTGQHEEHLADVHRPYKDTLRDCFGYTESELAQLP